MKNYLILSIAACAVMFFQACDLEKEISIELPLYERQTFVECYLEPGQSFHLLLSKTSGYFDPINIDDPVEYFSTLLENDASVSIQYNGNTYELENRLEFNPVTGAFSNYSNDEIVPNDTINEFKLEIITIDGEMITGTTKIKPLIPFDSIVIEFQNPIDTLGRVLTYFTDPSEEENFYRRMLHFGSLDSIDQDFIATDEFNDQNTIVFGTGFDFAVGDTVINTLYHIDRPYFDFIISMFGSIDANGNPFAPGGVLTTNLEGDQNPLGIFTGLTYTREITIISK